MTNRYVCSALEEVRAVLVIHFKLINSLVSKQKRTEFHMDSRELFIDGLVEEIQTYVNRMEASLGDSYDMAHLQEQRTKIKKQRRAELKKLHKLEEQVAELEKKLEAEPNKNKKKKKKGLALKSKWRDV